MDIDPQILTGTGVSGKAESVSSIFIQREPCLEELHIAANAAERNLRRPFALIGRSDRREVPLSVRVKRPIDGARFEAWIREYVTGIGCAGS